MNFFVIKNLIFVTVVGGFLLYITYEEKVIYEPVTSTATMVEAVCYLEKKDRGVVSTTTYKTEKGDCTLMAVAKELDPEYRDYYLMRHVYITFDYISPVDGRIYSGRHLMAWAPSRPLIQPGDEYPILAHREEPERTMRK